MSEKEKETIEAEVVSETKEPKKDNVFKKFWNKTKDTVNSTILESKIEMKFKEENLCFSLYEKDSMLSSGLNGKYENDGILVFGKQEIENYSVILEDDTDKAYYVVDSNPSNVDIVVDGVSYNRPATFITIDKNVEEVNVIKAGKKYYLYKGK